MPDYRTIFERVEATLIRAASRNMPDEAVRKYLNEHKQAKTFTDSDYFHTLTYVPFYSGMRAATVTERMPTIRKYFSDPHVVAQYDSAKIAEMLTDPTMLRNRKKIEACVHNAQRFVEILGQHATFQGYIDSFAPRDSHENVLRLREDVVGRFEYLSKVTSFHFLCKIGMPVIKPDVAIRRIFYRLGLTGGDDESESTFLDVVRQGEALVQATGNPHRYVDIVFAHYGQMATPELDLERGICLPEKPQCDVCGVSSLCRFFLNQT